MQESLHAVVGQVHSQVNDLAARLEHVRTRTTEQHVDNHSAMECDCPHSAASADTRITWVTIGFVPLVVINPGLDGSVHIVQLNEVLFGGDIATTQLIMVIAEEPIPLINLIPEFLKFFSFFNDQRFEVSAAVRDSKQAKT